MGKTGSLAASSDDCSRMTREGAGSKEEGNSGAFQLLEHQTARVGG